MSDQSPSTFHEEIMLLAEKMGELHDRFAKIETEFSAQTAPLDAAKSTQDSALVALNAALEGIKQLNFHVLDNNLGAVSKRVDEVGKQADTAIQAVDKKLDQESTKSGEAFTAIQGKLAQLEATRVKLAKTRDQDTKQFSLRLSELNKEIAYARETLAEQLQAAIKQFATPAGLNPRGKWNPQDTYARLDIVSLNGSSYVSMADNNKEKPGRGSKLWGLLASRGGSALGGGATDITGVAGIGATGLLLVQSATASDARDILGVNDFTGATSGADGTAGRVIKPEAGDQTKYLRGDGTWTTPSTVTAPAASQSEVDAGTEDAKYVNPVTLHGYVEPLVNQRQAAPRILSDGATTNRAIIGQFGDVGDVAGSAAITHAVDRAVIPSSAPAANIILAAFAPVATSSPITQANSQTLYIDTSGKLVLLENGSTPATDFRKYTSDASVCNSTYAGLRRVTCGVTGGSATAPAFTLGGATIAATETTGAGTDPDYLNSALDCTNHLCGYTADEGEAPIAAYYNYLWDSSDALAWSGGGALPYEANFAGDASIVAPDSRGYSFGANDANNTTGTSSSANLTMSAVAGARTGGAGSYYTQGASTGGTPFLVLDVSANMPVGSLVRVRCWISFTGLETGWSFRPAGSSYVNIPAVGTWQELDETFLITGTAGNSIVFTRSGGFTSQSVRVDDLQVDVIGAIDDPIIQPGLTTGDKHGRFSRRLLGMKSVPNTDRGQIISNTAAAADTQALGGPVFDNVTDYVLEGPIEQVPDGGTPDTDIGSTSGGVDYKATSTLASGVNPYTAATRKVGSTSIYVGSDDTTPVRTFIPFRKISTP